jgi:acetate---CoA ligase (ADP-forming)
LTLANLRSETYRDTIAALVDSPTYDALVVVVGSSGLGDPKLAAEPVRAAAVTSPKPVLVYVSPHALNIVSYLNSVGVPAFHTAEGCADALAALRRGAIAPIEPRQISVADVSDVPTGQLNEAESLALFHRFGISSAAHCVATTPEQAAAFAEELGRPVVVKILSREIGHKSDVGGVRVGVAPDDVASVCEELRQQAYEGWLVQEQIVGGVEMLLGVVRDPQLGLALVLGAGGVATEVFEDTALRLLPLRDADPSEMLGSLKSRVLLEGFRGRPPADLPALFEAMKQFGQMAEALGDRLLEAEINPLFVLPQGHGIRAADGLVVLRP